MKCVGCGLDLQGAGIDDLDRCGKCQAEKDFNAGVSLYDGILAMGRRLGMDDQALLDRVARQLPEAYAEVQRRMRAIN